jgi:hypothetical protein
MVLSANVFGNNEHLPDQELREFPVGAAVHLYNGAYVGSDPAGHIKAFEVGDVFEGIAYEEVDNSAGAAAAKNGRLYMQGDFEMTLSGAALTDINKPVFATADDAIALMGHPDAWIGNIVHYESTDKVVVRLKEPGQKWTPAIGGAFEIFEPCLRYLEEPGAAGGDAEFVRGDVLLSCALGLGVTNIGGEGNGWNLDFDAQDEVAHASCETKAIFPVDQGITFEIEMYIPTAGIGPATLDVDFGLGTVLETASRTDMGNAAMVDCALFHVDGAATTLSARSDNNTTDTGNVDTLSDVSGTAYGKYKIIVRKTGAVEIWQNGVRLLSSTTFAVRSTVDLAAFINAEKTGTATLSDVYFRNFRAAAGKAA